MPEGEEEGQETENVIGKHNEGELAQSGKGNTLSGSPGSSESPKEVALKEPHSKAHPSYMTQDQI